MEIPKESIEKFKKAYHEEFGGELTDEEAYDEFSNLVELIRVVIGEERLKRMIRDGPKRKRT